VLVGSALGHAVWKVFSIGAPSTATGGADQRLPPGSSGPRCETDSRRHVLRLRKACLVSTMMASQQADWPENLLVTGLPFYDTPRDGQGIPATSADSRCRAAARSFHPRLVRVSMQDHSIAKPSRPVRDTRMRAVLLIGKKEPKLPPDPDPIRSLPLRTRPIPKFSLSAAASGHQAVPAPPLRRCLREAE